MGTCNSKSKNPYKANDAEDDINIINYSIHDGSIANICAFKNHLVSCSEDKRVALFDWDLPDAPKYFIGHTKAVNRVFGSQSFIWSASRDLSIRQVIKTSQSSHLFIVACSGMKMDAAFAHMKQLTLLTSQR